MDYRIFDCVLPTFVTFWTTVYSWVKPSYQEHHRGLVQFHFNFTFKNPCLGFEKQLKHAHSPPHKLCAPSLLKVRTLYFPIRNFAYLNDLNILCLLNSCDSKYPSKKLEVMVENQNLQPRYQLSCLEILVCLHRIQLFYESYSNLKNQTSFTNFTYIQTYFVLYN